MKKLFFATMMALVLLAGCTKDDKKEGKPEIARLEILLKTNVSEKALEAFGFNFNGSDFAGKEFSGFVMKSGETVLCSKSNPVLTENASDNEFEIGFTASPIPGFTASAGDEYNFSYELYVRACDATGNVLMDSWFDKMSCKGSGLEGYGAASKQLARDSYSPKKRGVWIAQTTDGKWQIGCDAIGQ